MSTKPKLKKIPLPEGLTKLPEGAVYLGEAPLPTKSNVVFSGWCAIWIGDRWDHGEKWKAHGGGYLAAPADSAIAREILGKPAKPVTKRKSAKKTITKPSKTVTKPAKAKKPVTLDPSKESVGSALVAAAQTASFGIEFCESADRLGITLPNWLPALPPVPSGYDRWEPRGMEWSQHQVVYACCSELEPWVTGDQISTAHGCFGVFYIEAVRDEEPEAATDNASVHIELHRKEIERMDIPTPYTAEELATYWAQKGEEIRRNSAVGLLTEAAETIGARAAERDVGSERSMAKCVAAFNVMFGKDITEEQGWLFMALLKMSRSTVGHRRDDFLDGAAYMGLAGECALNQDKS